MEEAPPEMTIQSLSKLDAATRQLHLAIELYFQDADLIGVHTLAGAAHGLLRDLLVHRDGRKGLLTQSTRIQPNRLRFVTKMVTEAKNFLKHADRDPNGVLRFTPNSTDFLLFEAIGMHIDLTRDISRPNTLFLIWVSAKYPSVLLLDNILGDGISELRRIFPELGRASVQKRTFRLAMNRKASSDVGPG